MADRNWFNCIKHFLCCSRDLFIDPNQQKCWQTLTKFNERLGHTYIQYIHQYCGFATIFCRSESAQSKIFSEVICWGISRNVFFTLGIFGNILLLLYIFSIIQDPILLLRGGICSLSFLSGSIFNSETSICCSSIMVLNTLWKNSTFPSITYFICSS